MERSRIGSRGSYHDGIIHGTFRTESIDKARYSRTLLSDSDINTVNRVTLVVFGFLVDDSVQGNGGLSCLAVSDDELTLTATDRNHGINGLDTCLERFVHRLTEDYARRLALQRHLYLLAPDFPETVNRITQRVNDTAQHFFAYTDGSDTSGPLHRHAFLDFVSRSEKHGTYIIHLKVHHDTHHTTLELKQFACLSIGQAIYSGHTVADLKHGTDLFKFNGQICRFELFEQHVRNLAWFYIVLIHNKLLSLPRRHVHSFR